MRRRVAGRESAGQGPSLRSRFRRLCWYGGWAPRPGDRLFGDVASTLVTHTGRRFSGVCIDTGSGTGFCAEHSAIAAMVTAGEYRIAKIVAVWNDEAGSLYVMPPCGRSREFIRQVDPANLDTEVILDWDRSVALRELLPAHEWPRALDDDPLRSPP